MRIQLVSPLGIIEKGAQPVQRISLYPQLDSVGSDWRVLVMCNGISGHAHSEVASAVVAQAIGKWMEDNVDYASQPTAMTIRKAVAHAQENLNDTYDRFEMSRYPMGTTMALLAVGRFGVVSAHIGDTRIYHIRPSRREILYRSRDHSLVNDLFVAGRLTRAEAEASSKKKILTRAMLPAPSAEAKPDVAFITDIEVGDYFVMCNNGMTGAISDKILKDILCNSQVSNAQKVAALQKLSAGVALNHSFLLIEVASVEKDEDDRLLVNTERLMCDKMVHRSVILAPAAPAVVTQPAVAAPTAPAAPAIAEPPVVEPPSDTEPDIAEAPAVETPNDGVAAVPASDDVPANADGALAPITSQPNSAKNRKSPFKMLWMIVAFLILTAAIFALLSKCSHGTEKEASTEKSKNEEPKDTDFTVNKDIPNNVVPNETMEPFSPSTPTGSNVSVPPAPSAPNLSLPRNYETGSNVSVPRVKNIDVDPYPDAFDDGHHYKDLEKQIPETPDVSKDEPKQPAQPPTPQGSVPQRKPKVSNDPTIPNRNPPPSRSHGNAVNP